MTFSIAARCARTKMFGISVSSSSPSVAARCAHARAGVGAVATQNITDPTLGPDGLDLLAYMSAPDALAWLTRDAPDIEYRQITMIDAEGKTAAFSGKKTLGVHGTATAQNVVAAGNLLSSEAIPDKMVAAFLADESADLGDRILAAMKTALAEGGEEGPVHSAGMLIVDEVRWPIADLRVDWHESDPIGELEKLWALWKPQAKDYVTRALNPSSAPAYGVPGDER
ncbi:hypothetical protein IZ6_13860 [Terrihabitans soli]|uniref:DUF1028 domain-containing protein n=1 Tax=Terrihabitans soli TaxID=708113 RepID=A0A6S6QU99_9HYPH|nr:DUF1028 domain-containing protein [Terrihabitans soli]BCJ90651.1 hypothetical protein IZ6_13860 [Terrihabitans soli]